MALVSTIELIIAIIAAAFCGALALPFALVQGFQASNRARAYARVLGTGQDREFVLARFFRNGFIVLRPFAQLLLQLAYLRTKCESCVKALGLRGFVASVSTVCESLIVTLVIVVVSISLLTGSFIIALIVAGLALVFVFGKVQKQLGQREERLVGQIPDALRSLGICFNSGYSLQQALEQTALDTPDPLGPELKQVCFDVNAGRSIEEALSALEDRTKATDLRFVIVALEIQHKTGGSLQDLLEDATDAVLASAELRRQLAVQTAQARLSAKVVTVLPLVLVAALSVSMDGYLQTFFSSPEGLAILVLALGMEALGVLLIRKILGIDLG